MGVRLHALLSAGSARADAMRSGSPGREPFCCRHWELLTGCTAIFNVIWRSRGCSPHSALRRPSRWQCWPQLLGLRLPMVRYRDWQAHGWGPCWERQSGLSRALPLPLTSVSQNRRGSCWCVGGRRTEGVQVLEWELAVSKPLFFSSLFLLPQAGVEAEECGKRS